MLRRTFVLTLVVGLASVQAGAAQGVAPSVPRTPEITSGGVGTRRVDPDRASVIVSVETRARTPSAAGALNARRNNAVRAAIAAVGVPPQDITTYGYNVYAVREEPPYRRDTGFVASNALRVLLRRPEHLSLLGRVIDTALTAGATHVAGVHYAAQRTDDAEREALADALTDARARAEAVARAANGSLGELVQVMTQAGPVGTTDDMEYGARLMRVMPTSARAEPTSVTAGEIEIRQYVTARWRFVPGGR